MPTLNWIGKAAVIKHHKDVPYRLLEPVPELSCGDPNSGNLIVQGDNLHALKALLPRYAGQVKCIYIDPPYNTGQDNTDGSGWVYSDKVDSTEIRAWLGSIVGKENEDLTRHDKWLCMMYPRLALLRDFLCADGVIAISLDDIEIHTLRLLMDEIFGKSCFLGQICWKTRNTDNRVKSNLSTDHEYIVVYGRTPSARICGRTIDRSDFKNPDRDPRGPYVTDPLTGKATKERRRNLHFQVVNPGTGDVYEPDPSRGWITDKEGFDELIADQKVWWPANPTTGNPRKKRFLFETKERMPGSTLWADIKSQSGADELDQIMGERVFPFPKPLELMERVVDWFVGKDDLVLDSFGGSGTTAHALARRNKEDGGNRRFLLVEMDADIAANVTAERVKRIALGYENGKGETVTGLGGGFQFCRLSQEPLFTAAGQIRADVRYAQLADFVWFRETGTGYTGAAHSPLLGVADGRAIYLLYNGILKDKSAGGGNVLTHAVLAHLPAFDGPSVIYAAASRLGAPALTRAGIVFKQTPYALEV